MSTTEHEALGDAQVQAIRIESLPRLVYSHVQPSLPPLTSIETFLDLPLPDQEGRTFRDFLEEVKEVGIWGYAARETEKSDVLFRYWIRPEPPAPSPLAIMALLVRGLGTLAGLGDLKNLADDLALGGEDLLDVVEVVTLDALLVLLAIRTELEVLHGGEVQG